MKRLVTRPFLFLLFALVGCGAIPTTDGSLSEGEGDTPLTTKCGNLIIDTQSRVGAANEQLVEANIKFLSTMTPRELRPENGEEVNKLADKLRENFINLREVVETETFPKFPRPISAGAGFATVTLEEDILENLPEAEHLLAVYQGNTTTGACNYPFGPNVHLPIDPDDPKTQLVRLKRSVKMASGCGLVASIPPFVCRAMEGSLFLNLRNINVHERVPLHKRFYDKARFVKGKPVYTTFDPWDPGQVVEDNSWPLLGFLMYKEAINKGVMVQGRYVFFEQGNFKQVIMLYLKPFEAFGGGFGGTAYSFVNLYDEWIVNKVYKANAGDGTAFVCPLPPNKCNDNRSVEELILLPPVFD